MSLNQKLVTAMKHYVTASVQSEVWTCDCNSCKLGRESGFPTTITPRMELKTILQLLREIPTRYKIVEESQLQDVIRAKRERLLGQILFERNLAAKLRHEPTERNYSDEALTAHQGTGGGRRIIRKGSEMS